ncbi:MAG: hypothetical protein ACRDI1_05115, partial [Actinomycetota bacterium]
VIDWANASAGVPEMDVALTWLLMSVGNPPGGFLVNAFVAAARGAFVEAFLRHFDRDRVGRYLPIVAEGRFFSDSNYDSSERTRASELLRKWVQV